MQVFRGPGRLPEGGPFPEGTTVADLLAWRRPFDAGEARAFHELGGTPPSAVTEEAGRMADPEARYFMIKFASEAAAHAAELDGYQDPEATIRRHPGKFTVLQGSRDPIRIQGQDLQRVSAMGVRVREVADAGHAAFADAPDQVARFISRRFWEPAEERPRPVQHRFHGNPPPPPSRRHPRQNPRHPGQQPHALRHPRPGHRAHPRPRPPIPS